MKVLILSGSRADLGILHYPTERLRADTFFKVLAAQMQAKSYEVAFVEAQYLLRTNNPDLLFILGDRFEIMAAATAAHLQRIPIAHLGGGDVTEGSYDDAMRDCISRMATWHFATSDKSATNLVLKGYSNVHMVGNPAVDYIMHADWRRERPIEGPYVVVAYYPETIDDTVDLEAVKRAINGRHAVWITPNPDRGSERIPEGASYSHDAFLTLLVNCEEFIGNSSAIFYEAPFLGVATKLIGKRQKGRVVPLGDGLASERMRNILRTYGTANKVAA